MIDKIFSDWAKLSKLIYRLQNDIYIALDSGKLTETEYKALNEIADKMLNSFKEVNPMMTLAKVYFRRLLKEEDY